MKLVEIKKLRKVSGLTLEQFANAIGVSIQTIINWEEGIHKPNKNGLAKLAKYTDKRLEKIQKTIKKMDKTKPIAKKIIKKIKRK